MHSEAKKMKHVEDADLESTNTPSYEQGDTIKCDIVVLFSNPVTISGTMMTLRPRGGLLNTKKLTGSQDFEPSCNKDTTGNDKPPISRNECKFCSRQAEAAKVDKGMLGHCQLCWVYPILGSPFQVRGTCTSGCHCSHISFVHPRPYGSLCRMGEPWFVISIPS